MPGSARIADDNRARNILLLDLREATPLVDFFVIATATSRRQSHAIAGEIDQEMKQLDEYKLGIEGSEEGRWILIDYGDFVVHIFSGEARAYYALEEIWGDAPRLDWQDTDSPPRPGRRPRGRAGAGGWPALRGRAGVARRLTSVTCLASSRCPDLKFQMIQI